MIKKEIKRYCKDYAEIENYDKAVSDETQYWHCHHRKEIEECKTQEQLKQEGLYYNRPPEEFIFINKSEHHKLHSHNRTEEHKRKISESLKGKKLSEETRRKISEAHKGKTHKGRSFTNEQKKEMSEMFKGKHHSDVTRRKIAEAVKSFWKNKEQIKIYI